MTLHNRFASLTLIEDAFEESWYVAKAVSGNAAAGRATWRAAWRATWRDKYGI